MFRYNDQLKQIAPAEVVYGGFRRKFCDLSREQWDEIGWNEAIPLKRDPFTLYETQWVKGGLIYREEIVTATVDEAAKAEHEAKSVRSERDRLLAATDWTQLKDSILSDVEMVLWQGYRQALRDVPQQAGFPMTVEWPEKPVKE